ncbi:excalibur calcium-binding domain-containing protein [Deinococcus sp. 6GRE01]|nr:excalibur calcium-binding domain-containing protein [Deinococcus sp. 6GRE01]
MHSAVPADREDLRLRAGGGIRPGRPGTEQDRHLHPQGHRPLWAPGRRVHGRRDRSEPLTGPAGLGATLPPVRGRHLQRRGESGKGLYADTFQNPWDYRKNPSNPPTAGTAQTNTLPPIPATTSITYANCAAVRAARTAPLLRDQPGYAPKLERDDDGVACE